MNRYTPTERLGVNTTERIVIKDFCWIFREQSIVDVGVDAIVEESVEGNPTGKLIALQIKSGNYDVIGNKITHYVTHIHYNYWLSLSIPILLIIHLPESDKTYWQHICKNNFIKTNKQWKVEIPTIQEFNKNSKQELRAIFSDKNVTGLAVDLYRGKIEPDTIFDLSESVKCVPESKKSMEYITNIIQDLTQTLKDYHKEFLTFISQGLNSKDAQVEASIRGLGRSLNTRSIRLETEIELFAILYSTGLFAYEQMTSLYFIDTQNVEVLKVAIEVMKSLSPSLIEAMENFSGLKNSILKLPDSNTVFNEARSFLLEVISLLINEFSEAKRIAEKISANFTNQLDTHSVST